MDSDRYNLGGKGKKARLVSGGVKGSFERLSSGKVSQRLDGDDNSVSSSTVTHHR